MDVNVDVNSRRKAIEVGIPAQVAKQLQGERHRSLRLLVTRDQHIMPSATCHQLDETTSFEI